ncbi:MAG: conserved membrane protein of unknown function [Promethearchaeota archaeon]|nr:MAG: conserved membrane protein of unknown function [Candidatus Lokiarchaeota archaeon]
MGEFINHLFIISYILLILAILGGCSYLDIKYRKISSPLFKILVVFLMIINISEFIFFHHDLLSFIVLKITIFIILFSLSFILFILKIIGGADGKLIIVLFLLVPVDLVGLQAVLGFFLTFSSILTLYFIFLYLKNRYLNNSHLLELLIHNFSEQSNLKKIFFKTFYRLVKFSELNKTDHYQLRLRFVFYNFKEKRFQFIGQAKPPLILIISLSYIIFFFSDFK